jgi:hypothetical protein
LSSFPSLFRLAHGFDWHFSIPTGLQTMFARLLLITSIAFLPFVTFAVEPTGDFVEHISDLVTGHVGSPVKLTKGAVAATKATFKPPVEILIEAKTNSTNLRMSYAANAVIFNWERNQTELRVDGGPAGGKHKPGAGLIPTNKYVTIRWVVTPTKQSIEVDGQSRYEHSGDYSKINNPVAVFCANGSEVTVKSIKVRQLPADTQ